MMVIHVLFEVARFQDNQPRYDFDLRQDPMLKCEELVFYSSAVEQMFFCII
jgi:hypothetical protein